MGFSKLLNIVVVIVMIIVSKKKKVEHNNGTALEWTSWGEFSQLDLMSMTVPLGQG